MFAAADAVWRLRVLTAHISQTCDLIYTTTTSMKHLDDSCYSQICFSVCWTRIRPSNVEKQL